MLSLHPNTRYFLYQFFIDMRKSFDGLCGIVTNEMHHDILSNDVFIFFNKRKTHIKLLTFEGDGFAIYYKRLEKGTYEFTTGSSSDNSSQLSYSQLLLILQGISLKKVQYRKRYKKTQELSTSGVVQD
ncbi:MAG: IS66 family insertion sequence element accessory protein TnpB [Candidatus Saccharimonadales bacterium]